jgi:hypothetical protein
VLKTNTIQGRTVTVRLESMKYFCCLAALFLGVSAQGSLILGNLGTSATSTPADPDPYKVSSTSWAVGFTVSQTIELNTISISASGDSSKFVVEIWTHNASGGFMGIGAPGSVLANGSFTGPSSTTGQGGYTTYTFNANALELTGSSTYWAVIKSSDSTPFFIANRGAYTESGATFLGSRFNPGPNWFDGSANLSVELTAVPEPIHSGAIAAAFLVLCALSHACGRRQLLAKARSLFR